MKNKFIEMLNDLGIKVTDDNLQKLELYYNFLNEYNEHTNITRIVDYEDVYFKHFYDSLTIVKAVDLNKVNNLLDIGSGAGFPGMVLKIFFPNIDVTLIDSNNKKTQFLKELSEKLDIKVDVICGRVEDYYEQYKNSFDLVTSRAVAYIDIILTLSLPFVNEFGSVVLMKGNFNDEKQILDSHLKELNIKDYKIIDVSYMNNERNLVILKRNSFIKEIMNYSQIVKRNKRWKIKN